MNNKSRTPDYLKLDEGSGFVYLVEAEGYHGWLLSAIIKRRKIGLTNNPERRLKELNSEQAPCPIVGIRYISVSDNAAVEKALHHKFKDRRRHGEWFDFWIWELPIVDQAFDRVKKPPKRAFSRVAIAGVMLLAFGVGGVTFALFSSFKDDPGASREVIH